MYREEQPLVNKKVALGALGLLAVAAVIGVVALTSAQTTVSPVALSLYELEEEEFKAFMTKYGKVYNNDVEYAARLKTYRDNSVYIRMFNNLGENWTLAVNEFADMRFDEFKHFYTSHHIEPTPSDATFDEDVEVPTSVDWRSQGAVTNVKNQGQCGSCWSFSTTGAVEGAWKLAGHELVSLSEQQLVDCSTSYGNNGCNGGLMDDGFKYVRDHGLVPESKYPYNARDGSCQESIVSNDKVASISGYKDVARGSSNALKAAIANQPVSVAVEADQTAWQFYSGGVVDRRCGTNLDHGVLAVGYDTSSSPNYYWVKNSWGTGWGISGYIKIAITSGNGMCGIQMMASYPVV